MTFLAKLGEEVAAANNSLATFSTPKLAKYRRR